MKNLSLLFFLLGNYFFANTASIVLHAKSAIVWLPQQKIEGEIIKGDFNLLHAHVNDSVFTIAADKRHHFVINVLLKEKINRIWVEAETAGIKSEVITYKLGYTPLPEADPFAITRNNKIFLHANLIKNPYNLPLSCSWSADERNPSNTKIKNDNRCNVSLDVPIKQGDYYFNLLVIAGKDSVQFQTLISINKNVHCFNLQKDHAAWIDSAILYEITPHIFTENKNYDDITAKLPEMQQLGINCIWLQPVYQTHHGHQAYDVTDFFSLRTDIGNETQLQHLITKAKLLHIKVIFDFVPNHTSIFHPYAQDVINNGKDSHYYNFYQHEDDGAPYSSLYKKDSLGFFHYFWPELINLNYNNQEVQQWIIEACKYWLRKYDLDGFRFDAMWAANARNDSFATQLQTALKSIKPDILLLSEDKGENEKVYKGFDAAYDWRTDTNWISHWSWQYTYNTHKSHTIFNYPDESKRSKKLDSALFSGDQQHLRLRFIENNDLPRFTTDHTIAQTKMTAAFLFTLPGIPLLYNGQEIGCNNKMYMPKPVFKSSQTIQSLDSNNLFNYYKKLIDIRKKYASLRSKNMESINVDSAGAIIALRRWINAEQIIVVMNMSSSKQPVIINAKNVTDKNESFFTDILSNENFSAKRGKLNLNLQPESIRLLLLH